MTDQSAQNNWCFICAGADDDPDFDACAVCGRKGAPLPYGAAIYNTTGVAMHDPRIGLSPQRPGERKLAAAIRLARGIPAPDDVPGLLQALNFYPRSKLMDDELRRACIAYNSVLLHQPEDCRDQTAAMHAAIAPILARLSAAEARAGVLGEALGLARDRIAAWEGWETESDSDPLREIIDQALTQEPTP